MSFFRFRWLYNIIRKNTSPIPGENAAIWKRRLSMGYAFLAWNVFGFVLYTIYKGKSDWAAYHGLKSTEEQTLTPGQQWARTLGKNNAEVYRLSRFELNKIEKVEDTDNVEQLQDSELKN